MSKSQVRFFQKNQNIYQKEFSILNDMPLSNLTYYHKNAASKKN